jgi:hypothetical protein
VKPHAGLNMRTSHRPMSSEIQTSWLGSKQTQNRITCDGAEKSSLSRHCSINCVENIDSEIGNEILSFELDASSIVKGMLINVGQKSNVENNFLQFCNQQSRAILARL